MGLSSFLRKRQASGLTAVLPMIDGLSLAEVSHDASGPRLHRCEFVPWPDAGHRERILRDSCKRLQLHKRPCATAMPVGNYSILSVEAPEVPPEEMKAAVRWRIRDLIDFHIDDAVIDIFDAPLSGTPGRLHSVYTVVAREAAVREQVNLLQAHDINLQIIDIPELALKNIAALLPGNDSGQLLVYFTAEQGVIVVVKDSMLYLARTMDIGYGKLSQAAGAEADAANACLERLVLEVQRTLDYYDRYFRQAPVTSLWLAPMVDDTEDLTAALAANLGLAVRSLDINELFAHSPPLDRRLQARSLIAIGTALRRQDTVF